MLPTIFGQSNVLVGILLGFICFEVFWTLRDPDKSEDHFKRSTWRKSLFSLAFVLMGIAATFGVAVYLGVNTTMDTLPALMGDAIRVFGPFMTTIGVLNFVWVTFVYDNWAIGWFHTPLREKFQTLVIVVLVVLLALK